MRTSFAVPVEYNGTEVILSELVECISFDRDPTGGDSGGAVVAGNTFVGIHVAGNEDVSYAVPAYQVFSTTVFKPRLELATDFIA